MIHLILRFNNNFSRFNKLKSAFYDFMNFQAGAVVRNAPQKKQRKYKHVQISKEFKQIQEKRKQDRLLYLEKRKLLLEQKINTESKLLTTSQTNQINNQLKTLESLLQEQKKQLQGINEKLEKTQPQLMLVSGYTKLAILNKIQYLKYLSRHPSGVLLNPQTIKVIQNVHYLVSNNLPVNRYKVYEIAPQFFQAQIGELDESTAKLINQKYLNPETDPSSRVRFYHKKKLNLPDDVISTQKLLQEKNQTFRNITLHTYEVLLKHEKFFSKVNQGQTPYRSLKHLFIVLLSEKLSFKLIPEEQALKNDLIQIMKVKEDWYNYLQMYRQTVKKLTHLYQPPPVYIENHPVLKAHWEKIMEKFTNPVDIKDIGLLPYQEIKPNLLQQKLRQLADKQFDPKFIELMNTLQGRQKLQKKNIEVEFYKKATQIYQDLNKIESKQQYFQKLPKAKRNKQDQQQYVRIKIDQLTKIISLNNTDQTKYSLDFFSNYYGIQTEKLKNLLNSVSYLRIIIPNQMLKDSSKGININPNLQQIKREIIKFKI